MFGFFLCWLLGLCCCECNVISFSMLWVCLGLLGRYGVYDWSIGRLYCYFLVLL